MERCPICRARWREEAVVCRRCGADLSHAIRLLKQGERLEHQAVLNLLKGKKKRARQSIRLAYFLRASDFATAMKSFL